MSVLALSGVTIELPDGCAVLRDVTLSVREGCAMGVVGESGAGKTLLLRGVAGQLPDGARVTSGEVHWPGPRGVAYLPQAAVRSLHPALRVDRQVADVVHARWGDAAPAVIRARARELIAEVGLPIWAAGARPHELSGGMGQRARLAVALAAEPELLLADEPTAGLDVVGRQEIARLLAAVRARFGTALLLVSHDLALVARCCDSVAVLYAGKLVEQGDTSQVLRQPRHPYTQALVAALPDPSLPRRRLLALDGVMPTPRERDRGCPFAARCRHAYSACATDPVLVDGVACHAVKR